MDYCIKQVMTDEGELSEIQALLQLVFKKRAEKFSLNYLRWQYAENPAGGVVGFNAYWDNSLAAHYATMPVYMNFNGEKTLGLLSLNTATHPEHRGKRLFTVLAERTYEYAIANGYKFVIGVANANSTGGFLKHLGFRLIGPLTFKIGVGSRIYTRTDYECSYCWDKQTLEWRLRNPSMRYYKNGALVVSPILFGFKKLVHHDAEGLITRSRLWFRPFNLYIGLGADLKKGYYVNLPGFIKHSPFNLIFRDLTGGALPEVTKENVLFELLDFDVA